MSSVLGVFPGCGLGLADAVLVGAGEGDIVMAGVELEAGEGLAEMEGEGKSDGVAGGEGLESVVGVGEAMMSVVEAVLVEDSAAKAKSVGDGANAIKRAIMTMLNPDRRFFLCIYFLFTCNRMVRTRIGSKDYEKTSFYALYCTSGYLRHICMPEKLREELLRYFEKPNTHVSVLEAVTDFPESHMNKKPGSVPYTFWHLLEHIRISQRDMLDFMRSAEYKQLEWPKDFWPPQDSEATPNLWKASLVAYAKDLDTVKRIIQDPQTDFFAPIPRGTGQTAFRELLQILDHTAYHTGEFVLMRREMDIWIKNL